MGESQTWKKGSTIPTDKSIRLCRCGQSAHKPFCGATHARVGVDGNETAPTEPSSDRREQFPGTKITLTDDEPLCVSAAFCHNHVEDVWGLVEKSDDSRVRSQLMHMVEQCPSGRLVYELADGSLEPDMPVEIGVIKDGPYWVTGGEVTVTMSDGRELELRNRVTLCRCGHSGNKPLCDGTHKDIGFKVG